MEQLCLQAGGLLLPAGNYKYPFEFCLPSDLTESIQGIPEISLKYQVDAIIVDKGMPIFYACKDLRIIRTPALDALEPLQSASGECIWDDKLKYSIGIFPKAVGFGGTIQLTLCADPLTSGIALGDVVVRVIEIREFPIVDCLGPAARASRCIAENLTAQRHITLRSVDKGWMFNVPLSLPRKLGDCVQNLAYNEIKVEHKVEVIISVKELAGHGFKVSDWRSLSFINGYFAINWPIQLRAMVPLRIYMPLNAVFSTKGTLLTMGNPTGINEPASSVAPPMYSKQDQEPPAYTLVS